MKAYSDGRWCHRATGPAGRVVRLLPALGVLLAVALVTPALGQERPAAPAGPPGLGLLLGQGETADGAEVRRLGLTTRRLADEDRVGSLALVAEEHDGAPFDLLDDRVRREDVTLTYQSVALELKRYIGVAPRTFAYWALRGGYSRVVGRVRDDDAHHERFVARSLAPLGLLALPLALEHPGFLLLAFADGTAAGVTFDLVPEHVWLDVQVGATLLPQYRDDTIVLDERFSITRTLQLVVAF